MGTLPFGLIAATLGGFAIGVEREWSGHAAGPRARFAGIRTFTLLGMLGGLSGWLWTQQALSLAAVLLGAAGALVVVAYVNASRHDIDGTTEVSAMVVLGAGVLAGSGRITMASAVVAVTGLLLIEKSMLHTLVARLDDEDLRAAARFAVMAIVVLPLLPVGPYGPWGGIRPRELWMLVLFFSGMSFVAFLARRALGPTHGYPMAGLLGGFVSSTGVTLAFSRASRRTHGNGIPLARGVVAASTVLFVRVALATAVLNPNLAVVLVRYLTAPFLVGLLFLLAGGRHAAAQEQALDDSSNPLQTVAALQMAGMFQLVLFALHLIRAYLGEAGIVPSAAILGLTDIDALTLSVARAAENGIGPETAARAIVVGIVANAALKLTVTLVAGEGPFRRRAAAGLVAIGVATAASLV